MSRSSGIRSKRRRRFPATLCLKEAATLCLALCTAAWPAGSAAGTEAKGRVFHDQNGNGTCDESEKGIAKVAVSNGREVTLTDEQGRWALPSAEETDFFLIKPRGWTPPLNEARIPQFYYIHRAKGSPKVEHGGVEATGPLPESIDFPLVPSKEPDRFDVVFFADTQPYSIREVEYVGHDVVEELIGVDAVFGVTLGDIVGNDLSLFEPLNAVVAHVGRPWYYVIGNHDMNFDVPNDSHSAESYSRVYGPRYYAFDYGPVHFVALDSIKWIGETADERGHYIGELDEEQLDFLRNDLEQVPSDRLVVFMMHIPLHAGASPGVQIINRRELFELIEDRPHTFSISGHMHFCAHYFFDASNGWKGDKPHHHVTIPTVSGSWWRGAPDEVGIPHTLCRDGAPNGYVIATFDGTGYSLRFKAARRPADYQMNIYAPEEVARDNLEATVVQVNVFLGSPKTVVKMRVGEEGPWCTLKQVHKQDPAYAALKEAEQSDDSPRGRNLPDAMESPHLWEGNLPSISRPGTYTIQVEATDMFGRTDREERLIRVK